ncbi:Cellobiose dehydrogenase [Elsinoe australis]|uniref:Cellobiose dehydrogenase n=1 Tax=Elsinoe australis TaxID=40998 RepID=A0A2P7YMX1_9PEZI|nr:Cellobiose dehydrogenase [Elsinoe australis]
MASTSSAYDFIVVGAGAAGCILARRLADSKTKPSVLLIEAGGKNDQQEARIDGERFATFQTYPLQNWSYTTIEQPTLANRTLAYDRGKGLGGSTAINFACWTIAGRDDHDEVARLTGDPEWRWENAQARYKRIEGYGVAEKRSDLHNKYLDPKPEDHGITGPIKVGFPKVLEASFMAEMDHLMGQGLDLNHDMNSGNQLGIAAVPNTAFGGIRSTAADALQELSNNLTVITDTMIARVTFKDKTATGVETIDGKHYHAKHEVILTSGAIDSPKILLHSGIGPSSQLTPLNIPVVIDNPSIGTNLQDHPFAYISFPRRAHINNRFTYYNSASAQSAARQQWIKDGTGPLAEIACQICMGFFQHPPILRSPEFQALPPDVRRALTLPTTPHYEICGNMPNLEVGADLHTAPPSAGYIVFLMNPQSRGRVYLTSSDPATQAAIDLNMLSHPYDRVMMREATKELMRLGNVHPGSEVEGAVYAVPASGGDEDVMAYLEQTAVPTWHATGTVAVGSCLDRDFRVKGARGLRVADLSAVPVLPNCHTQSTAYLVGLMAGDRLVEEYGLDAERETARL